MRNRKNAVVAVLFLVLGGWGSHTLQAKAWQVRSSMSLAEIQTVFDHAGDGDKIMFHKGVYDFSAGPFLDLYTDGGAIVISDKSLSVQGVGEVLIVGRQSELDSQGQAIRGVSAFWVSNPGHDKDVSFSNLKFQTFMFAIVAVNTQSTSPLLYSPCARDITISDCVFDDMQRNAVGLTCVSGNITIRNNRITAVRFGLFISWYWSLGHQDCQVDNTLIDIRNNRMAVGRGGIVMQNTNRVRLNGNTITGTGNFHWYGISVEGLKTGGEIRNNRCDNVLYGIELYAAWVNDPLYPSFEESVDNTVVSGNVLTGITNTGIMFDGGLVRNCRATGNRISLSAGAFSGIYSDGYSNRYENNVIDGSGNYACGLFGADYSSAGGPVYFSHDEYVAGNRVAGFIPTDCHYWLGYNTHDNRVSGVCSENATVTDHGIANEITCLVPTGSAVAVAAVSRYAGGAADNAVSRESLEK